MTVQTPQKTATPAAEPHGGKNPAQDTVVDGANYEVLRRRLTTAATSITERAEKLNSERKTVFGGLEISVLATERVRTENNCIPRDMVSLRSYLLLGYEVFVGLRQETQVSDVFALHKFERNEAGDYDLSEVSRTTLPGLFDDAAFLKDFGDVYRYYRETRLLRLQVTDTRLFAAFQVGAGANEVKVFRWRIDAAGSIAYMDNRGDREFVPPPAHDFEWTLCTRDHQRTGRFPHLSILDEVFVETLHGDLTIKIENNTESGQGIYSEPVEDANQSLDDAEIHYAKIGALILLKIKPFRETSHRYLVFNSRTRDVRRLDSIGISCRQLPEGHGIVFPNGSYLVDGGHKLFDLDAAGFVFDRMVRSPNGEDVLFVYHDNGRGLYALLAYNLIRKDLQTPILAQATSLFADGRLLVFRSQTNEPSRVHPVQVWQTPFTSAEIAAEQPVTDSFLSKVGNAELVRGVSDAGTLARRIHQDSLERSHYEELIASCQRMIDGYYWLGHPEAFDLKTAVLEAKKGAELVVDELDKVIALKKRADEAVRTTRDEQKKLFQGARPEDLRSLDEFMRSLASIRKQRGTVISLRELRYVDLGACDALEKELATQFDSVARHCAGFLTDPAAFAPISEQVEALNARIAATTQTTEFKDLTQAATDVGLGLEVLSEVIASLPIEDAQSRTQTLERVSSVFSSLNRVRAALTSRKKELGTQELRAEFAAQMQLWVQTVSGAVMLADTPDKCDAQLARLMVQIEEYEARFGEVEEFVTELGRRRTEAYDALEGKKQRLADERQRRGQALMSSAERILESVSRRARSFKDAAELHSYFASDMMVAKLHQIVEQLQGLGDTVRADELIAREKSTKQEALRLLRDKTELFDEGANVVKFGRHGFSFNAQPLELAIVPRDETVALHLVGTDYYEPLDDPEFLSTKALWSQELVSETNEVYRAEYLAATLLLDAELGAHGLSLQALRAAALEGKLLDVVRERAAQRLDEGYERGVHDQDAALILGKLLALVDSAGSLRYPPNARSLASLFWAFGLEGAAKKTVAREAQSIARLSQHLGGNEARADLRARLTPQLDEFAKSMGGVFAFDGSIAADFLIDELAAEPAKFVISRAASALREEFAVFLDTKSLRRAFEEDLRTLESLPSRLSLVRGWLSAFARHQGKPLHVAIECAVLILCERALERHVSDAVTSAYVEGIAGTHPRIQSGKISLELDEFLARLTSFVNERVPQYRAYRALRTARVEEARKRMRLEEFKAKPMSTFVRNQLINDAYLPLVGDNLAKQIGAVGAARRTDTMGLLLLVSPPGYGKTTLMEYVASRLGLVFVKVNGPSLGHEVHSLDPAEAPNATARQEVEKVNFALEMGNNVMLYLDDIQHTHPEFLQKFISLCDAQRRIEGVWKGETRTYDLRGKRFVVVMAGNPYTETGEKFRVPDMLANRADTYNLGEILEGKSDAFALSYIENAMTANAALAPLATREQADLYRLVKRAKGEEVPATEFSYSYSASEMSEMIAVLQRLFRVRDVLLKVNAQYIASASQEDAYRTEPTFKLQGSYRNMIKLAGKVASAMNDDELERAIDDHYQSESQTLTTGAEHNLLKLAEMRGRMTEAQRERWSNIKKEFVRQKALGGREDDGVTRVTSSIGLVGRELEALRDALAKAQAPESTRSTVEATPVTVTVEMPEGVSDILATQVSMFERAVLPLVNAASKNFDDAQALKVQIEEVLDAIKRMDLRMRG